MNDTFVYEHSIRVSLHGRRRRLLIAQLHSIKSALEELGHKVYIPVLNPDRPKEKKALFLDTLKRIKSADVLVAIIKSEEKSEGMLMEIGHALGLGKKVVVVIKESVRKTHLREPAHDVIRYSSDEEIVGRIMDYFGGR
ncbi:nucleoside 2-deoxyribosyltransferase [Candidatus Woesearchaeota archaeon]|nr:nucleoside 2-deoxyribosyltransferase [Candidatus Woesearchaeota archaeon]